MGEISGFHNSANGDRRYKADFWARFLGSFIGNGVYPNPSTNLQVIANGDMTVTVKAGKAWVNGVFYENTADKVITLEVADGVLKRIDRIVVSDITLERDTYSKVKKGSFASSPAAPALQRDADAYELGLADIYIENGAVSISQSNITDLRLNTAYCGIVHGLFDQVDTTTLFNQYQAWYLETVDDATTDIAVMLSAFQSSFNTWFADLQDTLDENTAANLLNKINDLIDRVTIAETSISNHTADIASLDTRLDLQERLLTSIIPTTGWSGTAPYSVAVTVSGLTDSRPDINPIYSATLETALLEKEAWNTISYIDCTTDTMTVTCLEEIPTTAINVELVGG
ncbi:hypothetical protein [Acetobacterium woodii]|uniref:Phage structural protein n=1 Tax=Acetobacterium woodii (strain ATCC 29683 / DSM 1030 / JCM 2381 / KCTC 1655 / WB1) TaxID=931626 RepID=H6LCA7_ACEWD|nr:hypothetical protein [Acetobacterium woodii]AFA50222.1 hypothetical protein Awo_c34980 [Acetobacterium woodii DSM 1030]